MAPITAPSLALTLRLLSLSIRPLSRNATHALINSIIFIVMQRRAFRNARLLFPSSLSISGFYYQPTYTGVLVSWACEQETYVTTLSKIKVIRIVLAVEKISSGVNPLLRGALINISICVPMLAMREEHG